MIINQIWSEKKLFTNFFRGRFHFLKNNYVLKIKNLLKVTENNYEQVYFDSYKSKISGWFLNLKKITNQ